MEVGVRVVVWRLSTTRERVDDVVLFRHSERRGRRCGCGGGVSHIESRGFRSEQ